MPWLSAMSAFGAANEKSFTPTSAFVPIREIALVQADGRESTVYTCAAGTEAGCLVDIADQTALDALVASGSVDSGTYTNIRIGTCTTESGYNVRLKGSVTIGSTPYVTHATSVLEATGTPDLVSVAFTGCSASFVLPVPLVVTASSSQTISLFVTLNNIAWGTIGGTTLPSGCVTVSDKSVCMAYPNVVPYVGTVTPSLEVFHLRKTASAVGSESGQLLLFLDASDALLGGTSRRLFSEASDAFGNFDTPLRSYEQNADGTYLLENFGSSASESYLRFPTFSRNATHTGTVTDLFENSTIDYTATKQ